MESTLRHSRYSRAPYDPLFEHIKPPDKYSLPSVTAFRCFSMIGFATCLLFTATILLSRRVVRHKSVPNFFGFLAFSSFVVNITWFTGNVNIWETKNPPSFALCFFQSSMIAGISTGQGIAACFLVFQVWLAICRTIFSSKSASYFDFMESPLCQWILFASPWIAWLLYALATIITGALNPSTIRPNSLYCATTLKPLIDARHYTSAVFAVIVVLLQIHLAYMSASQLIEFKRRQRQTAATIVANNDYGISIDLEGLEDLLQPTRHDIGPFVVRVLVFSLYTCFLVAATVYIAIHPKAGRTAFADIANASIAPLAFITFGSQADCLLAWRSMVTSAFANANVLRKRAFRSRRAGRPAQSDSPSSGAMKPDLAAYTESEKSKETAFSLSIDSSTTAESGDSHKPNLPVLLMDQPRVGPSGSKRNASPEDNVDGFDFLTALKMS